MTVLPEAHYQALLAARQWEQTEAFRKQYALRDGIEGTISQGAHTSGLRQARNVGLARIHFQHLFAAMATNASRVLDWLAGEHAAQAHQSAFVRSHAASAA